MLIEQLKADDINLRVTATRSLPAIAEALGPERVRAELVPFVNDSTDDEDEVRRRARRRRAKPRLDGLVPGGYFQATLILCVWRLLVFF